MNTCPDHGTCHHHCADRTDINNPAQCWRVDTCGPLSNVFPNDTWPDHLKAAHTTMPNTRPALPGERVDITNPRHPNHGAWGRITNRATHGRTIIIDLYDQHTFHTAVRVEDVTVMLDTEKRLPPPARIDDVTGTTGTTNAAHGYTRGDHVKCVHGTIGMMHARGIVTHVYPNGVDVDVQWDRNGTITQIGTHDLKKVDPPVSDTTITLGDRVHLVGMSGIVTAINHGIGGAASVDVQWDDANLTTGMSTDSLTKTTSTATPADRIDTSIDANAWLINQIAAITKQHEELTSGLVRVDRYHREAAHNLITELARIGYTITKPQP